MRNSYSQSKKLIAIVAKAERTRLGLSQEAFADACGIDRTYASQIERGIANPSLEVLCRIADALEISVTDLLGKHPS
ncbi:helix-turn-helix domain-containing protein [Polynucleobacter arcticus]|uniref:Transcriptional regulator n=1 Tax=Polynucleobacter arcticus TaxID=1743165 RepID=A0A6M9PMQ1_9BURK|nr:helix-turn-helix transcriptional regulator [Polynucleobacter arcticus]QKM60057.1 transcriptional regulator [Polynucleobacter arcticus]